MPGPTSFQTFQRMAAGVKSTPDTPWPPFPKIPDSIKAKFPDLAAEWQRYEEAIQLWIQQVQQSQ